MLINIFWIKLPDYELDDRGSISSSGKRKIFVATHHLQTISAFRSSGFVSCSIFHAHTKSRRQSKILWRVSRYRVSNLWVLDFISRFIGLIFRRNLQLIITPGLLATRYIFTGRLLLPLWTSRGYLLPRTNLELNWKLSESESYVPTDGQSASLTWNKAPIWGLRPDIYYFLTITVLLLWSALSDEMTDLSFVHATGPRQRSAS
jgi:hypothetical protein